MRRRTYENKSTRHGYPARLDYPRPDQKKILEEAGEVAEAITENNPVNTIREALDTMQTCATLINMVLDDRNIKLDKFLIEHREKKSGLENGAQVIRITGDEQKEVGSSDDHNL